LGRSGGWEGQEVGRWKRWWFSLVVSFVLGAEVGFVGVVSWGAVKHILGSGLAVF